MLHCRHFLRRVCISNHRPAFSPIAPRLSSDVTNLPVDVCIPPTLPSPSPSKTTSKLEKLAQVLSKRPVDHLLGMLYQTKPRPPQQRKEATTPEPGEPTEDIPRNLAPIVLYEHIRERDRSLLATLPVHGWTRIVNDAFRRQSKVCVDHLVADILEVYQGDESGRTLIIEHVLLCTKSFKSISPDHLFSLLFHLESFGFSQIKPEVFFHVIQVAFSESDKRLLTLLTPHLSKYVSGEAVPPGPRAIRWRPSETIRFAFHLVCKLSHIDEQQALYLYQALVDTGNIPQEATYDGEGPLDFLFIIGSTIVRSCFLWHWRHDATSILERMVGTATYPNQPLISLCLETINTLLETPSVADIRSCVSLIRKVDRFAGPSIPHRLVESLYTTARDHYEGRSAEILFSHTQSSLVSRAHKYPLPPGRALRWLLKYLTTESRNVHLGRVLANKVVDEGVAIPVEDRAQFIELAAAHGFGTQARALWERYSVGRDRNVVVGHSGMMLRLISLYSHLIEKEQAKLEGLDTVNPGEPDNEDSRTRRLKDLTGFVERVLQAYRGSKHPLSDANHYDLTSLARVYFMLGRVASGFRLFKLLMEREEVPDLYDINIALCVLAEHSPQAAVELIERMVRRGYKPDAITFDTVLHHVVLQGDAEEIDSFMRRARQLGHTQITDKSISSLVHRSLTTKDAPPAIAKANLERVLKLVESSGARSMLRSPNVGKLAVAECLRVDKPLLAFKFWQLLIEHKTEWQNPVQKQQRAEIAAGIRKHRCQGYVSREYARTVLNVLGE